MSLLPNEPDEAEHDDRTVDEYLTVEDTPFKRVIRGVVTEIDHYTLQDALGFHEDINHRGEAYDDDFKQACTLPPSRKLGNPHESEKRYYTTVAPTLATSERVEWVGSMGVALDTDPGHNKRQLRDEFADRFGDTFSDDVIGTAVKMYDQIRENKREYGRRTSLQELKAPKWSSGPRNVTEKEQAFNRLLPRVDAIEPPSRKADPDWVWRGEE